MLDKTETAEQKAHTRPSKVGTLHDLAKRVEKLTGPDRQIDAEIYCALKGIKFKGAFVGYRGETKAEYVVPPKRTLLATRDGEIKPVTASIDAAMTLVPEGFSKEIVESAAPPAPFFSRCRLWDWRRGPLAIDPENEWKSEGNRLLPLTIVAACLRARAKE